MQAVPGYLGHVPGKATAAAETFAESPMKVADKPRAEGAIPGYKGHVGGKVMQYGATYSAENRQARIQPGGFDTEVRPGQRINNAPQSSGYPQQGRADKAVPGYSGHCPGRREMLGATFTDGNTKAGKEIAAPGQDAWRRPSGPGVETRRHPTASPAKAIPGYKGHIPGKTAEADVLGQTWGCVNQSAVANFNKMRDARSPNGKVTLGDKQRRTEVGFSMVSAQRKPPKTSKPTSGNITPASNRSRATNESRSATR